MNTVTRRKFLSGLVGALTIAGCVSDSVEDTKTMPNSTDLGRYWEDNVGLKRVVDEEAGIVLYITNEPSYGGVSIDTIPLSNTDL